MSPSFWQILIVVLIVAVLFGGKRLRNLGGDLGASLKGFKKAMNDDSANKPANLEEKSDSDSVLLDAKTESVKESDETKA